MSKIDTRSVIQIMADAAMMDQARREHEENALSPQGRAGRLAFVRAFLDPSHAHA